MDLRLPWSRAKTAAMVFGAAIALVLAWGAYAAIKGVIELPHSRAAGAITPALQRFVSATSIVLHAAQALLAGAVLLVGFWLARRVLRHKQI